MAWRRDNFRTPALNQTRVPSLQTDASLIPSCKQLHRRKLMIKTDRQTSFDFNLEIIIL